MQMLLLGEHGHHDERVEVDAFAQHPEIVAAQHVHVEEMQDFTAHLQRAGSQRDRSTRPVNTSHTSHTWHHSSWRRRNTHVEDLRGLFCSTKVQPSAEVNSFFFFHLASSRDAPIFHLYSIFAASLAAMPQRWSFYFYVYFWKTVSLRIVIM